MPVRAFVRSSTDSARDRQIQFAWPIVSLFVIFAVGCSKADLQQAYNDAAEKTKSIATSTVESTVESIEARLPATGSIALQSSITLPPTRTAELRLITIGDGRPSVVQVSSYDASKPDRAKTYPAVLIHGQTTATNVASLAGTAVNCELFMQADTDSPVTINNPGTFAKLTFDSVNQADGTIHATMAATELIGSDGKTTSLSGGDVVAVVVMEAGQ